MKVSLNVMSPGQLAPANFYQSYIRCQLGDSYIGLPMQCMAAVSCHEHIHRRNSDTDIGIFENEACRLRLVAANLERTGQQAGEQIDGREG